MSLLSHGAGLLQFLKRHIPALPPENLLGLCRSFQFIYFEIPPRAFHAQTGLGTGLRSGNHPLPSGSAQEAEDVVT